MNVEIELLKQS